MGNTVLAEQLSCPTDNTSGLYILFSSFPPFTFIFLISLSNQNNAKYFLLYFKGKCTCKSFSWQCLFPPGLFHLKPLQSLFKVFNGGGITNNIKGKNFCHRRVLIMEIIQIVIPTQFCQDTKNSIF